MSNKSHWSIMSPHRKGLFSILQVSLALLAGVCAGTDASALETSSFSAAQQSSDRTVKVNIKDAAGPLAGASVLVKGTTNGADSDMDGNVLLTNVPSGATLVVSFIGYTTQEIAVTDRSDYQITLVEDADMLEELVVIGYGTVKKRDLTGSVSSVKSKELTAFTVSNPIQALQGRVPGLSLTTNNGSPDGSFNVRIRGTNSIKGDNSPLYIIDGMPSSASAVNQYDIESVEVLKDASATAIYGSRGANGVILITTKGGKAGKAQVSYNGEFGVKTISKKYDMMNAEEYMKFYNIQQINDNGKAYFTDAQIAAAGEGHNWYDDTFRNAPVHNHNISVSGGNEKIRFNVSGSAMLNEGIVKDTKYHKYNLRTSLDYDITKKWNLSLKMGYTYVVKNTSYQFDGGNRGGSLIQGTYLAPPTLTPFNEDGSYRNLQSAYPFMSNAICNPVNVIDSKGNDNGTEANMIDINGAITYKPFKGFSFRASFGYQNNDYRYDYYRNSKYIYGSPTASVNFTRDATVTNEDIVNYNVDFGKDHSLNVMGGFTYQQDVYKYLAGSGTGFLSDVTETSSLQSASTPGIPSTSYSKWSLMSWLARVNYSFKGRYLLTASIRADGSSRYSEGDKWGYFPSGALAWRISEEPWLKNKSAINDLKLRTGYGVTGSTAISAYATQNMLSSGLAPMGGSTVTFFTPSTTYPGSLKWETTSQFDVGIDLAMFDSRLRFTADYYYKMTDDLLNSVYLPLSSGYSSTLQNVGSMSNRGMEFLLEGEIISTKNWNWTASANIAFNKNRVEKLYGGNDIYGSNVSMVFIDGTINLIREDEPMGVFYVFESDGYDENGTCQYVDQNGDGVMDVNDRKILGNPHPDFTYGFNTEVSWKGLALSLFFSGSYGNDMYNFSSAQFYDYGMGLNMLREVATSHWDASNTAEQNAAAKYPKIRANQNLLQSDRFIEDGSYLRLKDIKLSYTFPIKKTIDLLQIYVSAQNWLTFTKYTGLDPEVNAYSSDTTIGIDYNCYPMSKTISVGAKIQF